MSSNIVITGASSGIGAAIAILYANQGVTLGLIGRNQKRLRDVAEKCKERGANVEIGIIDVRDNEILKEWIDNFDISYPIDLLIANAGISAGAGAAMDSQKTLREIFAINVDGVINSIMPAIYQMKERGRGQIAIMSSLAGIRGLPSCPAYSASKAAVRFLGEGLRGELKKDGVNVSVICPGYVETPMTDDNNFYMPFIMSPERAAKIIIKGLAKNKSRIAFPLPLYLPLLLLSWLPNFISDPIFAALPKK